MEKLFYSVGEVAELLGESPSLVRYWANHFTRFIKPDRNAKGNRLFRREDLETFKVIHFLVNNEGLTLEGVARRLDHGRKEAGRRMKVIEALKQMRAQLVEISDGL